ncbi:cob(I)yrinic acid a c-diamide adenosyltransferase [Aureimonas sp. Leaf454]|uniref:cob(I)yrinic acid a,c-diamide adenosyltransferase n=1 Tax=Aureimonas sp. Leaf454 TaxID=1736381 RepID=UPI0006F7A855|nr:cob(I)yrinic acid a,c-diamide adenosyltransferase [Aureimonas sp. Leaf454]KQT44420.1 cob(I)yrinic acid a c-diamide adenosyltransferase [Aureimonas sp. Leaf454]
MVKLNRIYTRTGDDGTTGLGSGPRRLKSDARLEAIGTVDELNATVGLARLQADAALDAMLSTIQNDLFDLGADLATPETPEPLPYERLAITQGQVERLEREIDAMNARLEPLKSFVLPAGSPCAAHLHLARTVCRRAERVMVALARVEGEIVGRPALLYVNRLSDHLFVASRIANDEGRADVLWVPGASR